MTLLAAFLVLLHRYTSQDDVYVGSPIANRTRAETEGLIGFFVNTLVLRVDCAGNPSFCELVGRVRQVALDAYSASGSALRLVGRGVATRSPPGSQYRSSR